MLAVLLKLKLLLKPKQKRGVVKEDLEEYADLSWTYTKRFSRGNHFKMQLESLPVASRLERTVDWLVRQVEDQCDVSTCCDCPDVDEMAYASVVLCEEVS